MTSHVTATTPFEIHSTLALNAVTIAAASVAPFSGVIYNLHPGQVVNFTNQSGQTVSVRLHDNVPPALLDPPGIRLAANGAASYLLHRRVPVETTAYLAQIKRQPTTSLYAYHGT